MPQDKQPSKSDIVSSIFNRKNRRRFSSLFGHREAGSGSGATVIKKRFPFGLDIGSNSIKVVQLGCDQAGDIKIVKSAIEELPKEAQGYASKDRAQVLAQVLKKLVEEKGLKGDCFVVAPYVYAKVNLVKLPPMPPGEIDKAVQWEIRQSTQSDLSELSFDYIVLEKLKVRFLGDQTGVLTITALKRNMFEYLALLESAGLTPLAIDIEPLADLSVLNYAKKTHLDNEVVLWLDFGGGKTSLSVICNNELISMRYLNVIGNSLTKAVSGYCRLGWEEAEIMKKDFGLSAVDFELTEEQSVQISDYGVERPSQGPSEKAIQVRNAIFPLLENMAQDIEHTFKYFSYQVSQSQITRFDKIVLSGGSSCFKGLVSFLRNRLNVEVILIDSLSSFESLGQTAQISDELSPRLNVALGLALRGLE